MKKILLVFFLIIIAFASFAQTYPPTSGAGSVPSSKTNWYQGDILQGLNAFFPPLRDTNWTPRYAGAFVFWQHAGVDSLYWGWDGLKWNKVGSDGSSIILQTNGITNGSQTLLNLIQGNNISLTDDGSGGVTIDANVNPITTNSTTYQFEDSTNTPPISFPSGFDSIYYMIGGNGNGIFTGHNYEIALYVNEVFDSFITPSLNDWGLTLDDGIWHQYDGSTWPRRTAPAWITSGNQGGGILGSTNPQAVYIRYNNSNKIIVGGSLRFPQLNGAAAGLMGLSTTGVASNVQIGSGLSLGGGVLSATGSGGTVTSVGLTMPTGFSVTGSPVTTSGTLAVTTSLNGILKGNGSGFGTITIGSGLSYDGTTLSATATTPGLQTVITQDPALTVDNTVTFTSKTLTWSGAREVHNIADSFKVATTNSATISSLAGINLWAVGTLTGRSDVSTISGVSKAYLGVFTSSSDSSGIFVQPLSGVSPVRLLAIPNRASGTISDSVLVKSSTSDRVYTVSPSVLQNWTRAGSGATQRLYPSNINDSVNIGSSSQNNGALFTVTGTGRISSFFSVGAFNPSSSQGIFTQWTNNSTANFAGVYSNVSSSGSSSINQYAFRSLMSDNGGAGSGKVLYGIFAQSQGTSGSGSPGTFIGGGFDAATNENPGIVIPTLKAVSARIQLGNSNQAAGIPTNTYALYTEPILNNSSATDSVRNYYALYIDSTASTLISLTNAGIYQVGTNAFNFAAGKTAIGYNPSGASTPTSFLQAFRSFALAYRSTATGITLDDSYGSVEVTATGQTITLPTAVGITGRIYTIKLTASGTGTVATTSSQNIDGSTTYSLSAQYKYVTVQSNGTGWIIIANN